MRKGSAVVRALTAGAMVALFVSLAAVNGAAQTLPPEVLKAFPLRSIGPSAQGGRFVDIAVPEQEPHTIYAATGSGGLWKSMNDGHSWEPTFDNERSISIGDIAVAPSNQNIVWVGSGEATSSRSTYWGDGVYKSTDAGKTWTNMGLPESHHVGRIVI
ncbi:MAG: glycosyl hydrolase, partial [Acidobacteria bacterium]